MPPTGNTFGLRECLLVKRSNNGRYEGQMNYPDLAPLTIMDWKAYRPALMHRCRHTKHSHSSFNILVLFLVTCFILATSRIHACAFSFLLTDNRYSAFNRDSSYLSLDNQYKRTTAFNTTPSKFPCLATIRLHIAHK